MANKEDLAALSQLAEAEEIKPVIERRYPLSEATEAIAHVGEGHAQGKTSVRM